LEFFAEKARLRKLFPMKLFALDQWQPSGYTGRTSGATAARGVSPAD
jgi:hypothetical protein